MLATVVKILESLESTAAGTADSTQSAENLMSGLCERAERIRQIVNRYRFVHDDAETASSDEKRQAILERYQRTLAAKRELVAKIQKMSVLQQTVPGAHSGDSNPATAEGPGTRSAAATAVSEEAGAQSTSNG